MLLTPKISLTIPNSNKEGRYFSFRLRQGLKIEHTEFAQPKRILVMPNLEGNFQAFCEVLMKYKVIDKYLRWSFGEAHLVIMGNCSDLDKQNLECLWLIYSLEEQARRESGHIHFILGYQEIIQIGGDWRYSHPNYARKKPGSQNPTAALYDGNSELVRWLCTKNIMEKIGKILFVHGGISPVINSLPYSVNKINQRARKYYGNKLEALQNNQVKCFFNEQESPCSYQGYYDNKATEEQVDETLAKFGIETIITCVKMEGQINGSYFNEKVINVIGDQASGQFAELLITRKHFYQFKKGVRERIK